MNTDRIEKKILLRAPRARVWRALTNPEEFGTWFRMKLEGGFTVGATTHARVTYPGYEHLQVEFMVEKMERERLFSYRWHPYPSDPKQDYSSESPTLVELRLEDAPGGTLLHVTESGFDKLPAARRDEAFRMNDGGWSEQLKNIEAHVTAA